MAPRRINFHCSVTQCKNPAKGLGLCNDHYQMRLRWGNELGPTPEQRLQKRMLRLIRKDPITQCWLWTGLKSHGGHGVMAINRKRRGAHRISWTIHRGQIPERAFICHKCQNPSCVNPDHLYVGDAKSNSLDMVIDGNTARGEKSGTCKLTAGQVRQIIKDKRNKSEIARDYGVSNVLIGLIKRGKIWLHISGPRYTRSNPKLDDHTIAIIKRARGRQIDIAKKYGISQVRVSQIKRRAA